MGSGGSGRQPWWTVRDLPGPGRAQPGKGGSGPASLSAVPLGPGPPRKGTSAVQARCTAWLHTEGFKSGEKQGNFEGRFLRFTREEAGKKE